MTLIKGVKPRIIFSILMAVFASLSLAFPPHNFVFITLAMISGFLVLVSINKEKGNNEEKSPKSIVFSKVILVVFGILILSVIIRLLVAAF